jgi:hypothetical protein
MLKTTVQTFLLVLGVACFRAHIVAADPSATLVIDAGSVTAKVSPSLYGIFFEEINCAGDGGIYAELIRNRTFRDDPKNPVSWEALEKKFRDCVSFSAKPVPAGNVDRAAELTRGLEDISDATEIVRLLA